MRRAKYNPLMVLAGVFFAGCAFTLLVVATCAPTEGDIEPIELEPPTFMGMPTNDCWEFFNKDGLHKAWIECMGVEFKSRQRRSDRMKPEGEITRVISDFVFYDSIKELRHDLRVRGGCTDCGDTDGISKCVRDLEANVAECLIMTVRPKRIDDRPTTVIGHEVEHGIYGRYHNE